MPSRDKRSKGKPEEAEEKPPEAVDEVRPLLRRCAGKAVEARITVPDAVRAFDATFKQASSNHVTFTLEARMDPAPLVGTVCTVTFFFDGYTTAFVSRAARTIEDARQGYLLTLDVPESVSSVEARRVFRIPADVEVPVTVTARFRGAKIEGALVDISRFGLRFAAERISPRATRGVDVELLLQWEEGSARVQGRIAGVEDGQIGIGLTDDPETVKASGYLSIVSQQERVALRRRKEEDEANQERKLEAQR